MVGWVPCRIAACILLYAVVAHSSGGGTWGAGGGGDAMGVTLVSTVPLPATPTQTQNVLANESKGLTHSEPKAVVKEPDAIPIADKNAKKKPKPAPARVTRNRSRSRSRKPAT